MIPCLFLGMFFEAIHISVAAQALFVSADWVMRQVWRYLVCLAHLPHAVVFVTQPSLWVYVGAMLAGIAPLNNRTVFESSAP